MQKEFNSLYSLLGHRIASRCAGHTSGPPKTRGWAGRRHWDRFREVSDRNRFVRSFACLLFSLKKFYKAKLKKAFKTQIGNNAFKTQIEKDPVPVSNILC